MNIFQIQQVFELNADAGSFLAALLIAVLFYYKYKELEAEAAEREMHENFLNE